MKSRTDKTHIPMLSVRAIRAHVGSTSFDRGEAYFDDGAIFDAVRCGKTLRASCCGSSASAYRLHVTFEGNDIAEADCSCPVGDGGACKHVAALLLTWLNSPEDFVAVEEVGQTLGKRDKAELIALFKQMLRQQPELESLLTMPLPGAKSASGKKVTSEDYRRQAVRLLKSARGEWGEEVEIARGLKAITEIGDDEGRIDDAIATVSKARGNDFYYGGITLRPEVAKVAE